MLDEQRAGQLADRLAEKERRKEQALVSFFVRVGGKGKGAGSLFYDRGWLSSGQGSWQTGSPKKEKLVHERYSKATLRLLSGGTPIPLLNQNNKNILWLRTHTDIYLGQA